MQRWQLTTCSTCMYLQRTRLNTRSCKMQKERGSVDAMSVDSPDLCLLRFVSDAMLSSNYSSFL